MYVQVIYYTGFNNTKRNEEFIHISEWEQAKVQLLEAQISGDIGDIWASYEGQTIKLDYYNS